MRSIWMTPLFFLFSCAQQATMTVEVVPLDDITFTLANGATVFQATATEAFLSLHELTLIDSAGVINRTLLGEQQIDLLALEATTLGTSSLIPRDINEIQIVPGDASEGDLVGLTLRFSYTVTLTDTTTSNVLVELSTAGEEQQSINSQIAILAGDVLTLSLAFDPARLLSGVDYDALSQNGTLTIRAGTGDPNIDAALTEIEGNLFTAFSLSEVR
jgi:hypothetical protein